MAIELIDLGNYGVGAVQSVFGKDGKTALELAGVTAKKVNDCIGIVNGVELTAIESQAIVDEMKNQQDAFIIANNDARTELITENNEYIDGLEASKVLFDNAMTTNINAFNDDTELALSQFDTDKTSALGVFATEKNNAISAFTTEKNNVISAFNTDAQTAIDNVETDVETMVDGKLTEMATNGQLTEAFNAKIQEVEINLHQFPRLFSETTDSGRLARAIAFLGATYDITSDYIFTSAKTLRIPKGDYIIDGRWTITGNNIRIKGDGWYNTKIKCINTVHLTEMVRFKGAYNCSISDINIDGGVPFRMEGTETFGADVGVTLDQCAFFESLNLNITNTRLEGIRAIHLWESYLENLRLHNIGAFGDATHRTAGIRFTSFSKEENYFAGGESNNITINKVAYGCAGCHISLDEVPVFNLTVTDTIAEGRTWDAFQPYPVSHETKYRISLLSNNIRFNGGYVYAHAQPFVCGVTLFDFYNCGSGCSVDNFHIYNENNNPSLHNELNRILQSSSAEDIHINIVIDDVGTAHDNLLSVIDTVNNEMSVVHGNIRYKTDNASHVFDSLFVGTSKARFTGSVSYKKGVESSVHNFRSKGNDFSCIGNVMNVYEEFKLRAWGRFNGVTGALICGGNVSGVVKNATGQYTVNFANPLPDTNYCVNVDGLQSNSNNERTSHGTLLYTGFGITNNDGATFYDSTDIHFQVFSN